MSFPTPYGLRENELFLLKLAWTLNYKDHLVIIKNPRIAFYHVIDHMITHVTNHMIMYKVI